MAAFALLALSLILAACGPASPTANGSVLNFADGDVKTLTNGVAKVTLTYNGDGNWTCTYGQGDNLCVQDVAGETMFFYGVDKIGTETINKQGEINLYGKWKEQTGG